MTNFFDKVAEIQKSEMSRIDKQRALVKMGLTKYEAECLTDPHITRATRPTFTYTFGVEMETIHCNAAAFMAEATRNGLQVINHLHHYSGCHTDVPQFKLVPDGSLSGHEAAECVTPALDGNNGGFASLKACCKSLKAIGAGVNRSCGLHVHIGAANLTDQEYCNVFVNYMRLETAIDSILAPSRRGSNSRWCKSLRNHEYSVLHATSKREMRDALNWDRYHRVNAEAYGRHQTIEFRQHQGTINFDKVEAWVKFLGKLVEWSRSHRLDANINRIEDVPFLTADEKRYFIRRRNALERA